MTKETFQELKRIEKEKKRGLIIEAAERVFSTKPFNAVSIRDIAKEAGISHALIYRYFPDQQALFVEAFLRGAEDIIVSLDAIISREGTTGREATKMFIRYLARHDHYFRMMTHFMLDGALKAESVEKLNAMERRLLDQFDRLFLPGRSPGEARLLSHAFFASLNGLLITFRDYPGRTGEEVLAHMERLGDIIADRFIP